MISTLRSQWPEPSPRPRSCMGVAQARVWWSIVRASWQRTRWAHCSCHTWHTTHASHGIKHHSFATFHSPQQNTPAHYTRAAATASRAESRAWNARLCTARASAASASGSTVGAAAAAATCRCKLARRGPTVLMSMGVKPSFTMAGEVAASCVQSLPCTPRAPHAGQAL